MAKAKYNAANYRAARAELNAAQSRGETLVCVQPVCLFRSRLIPPDCPADVAHDDAGLEILGPAHATCNRSDGGRRSRLPKPGRRWVL